MWHLSRDWWEGNESIDCQAGIWAPRSGLSLVTRCLPMVLITPNNSFKQRVCVAFKISNLILSSVNVSLCGLSQKNVILYKKGGPSVKPVWRNHGKTAFSLDSLFEAMYSWSAWHRMELAISYMNGHPGICTFLSVGFHFPPSALISVSLISQLQFTWLSLEQRPR